MHSEFLSQVSYELDAAFARLQSFQEEFSDVLTLVWREENSDLFVLQNPQLKFQLKAFTLTLRSHQYIEALIKTQLIAQADLGIFRVQTSDIQRILQ